MARFDRLRVSLLTAIAGCGPAGFDATSSSGSETTTDTNEGTSVETSVGESGTGTETGDECVGLDLCEDPVTVADGLVRCADGSINRVAAATYDVSSIGTPCNGEPEQLLCTSDADCNEAPNGSCQLLGDGYYAACLCAYPCASDADCDPGEACIPPGVVAGTPAWPSCVPASCRTHDDCGECGECGLNSFHDGCSFDIELACRGADDECRMVDDCPTETGCAVGPNHYVCAEATCIPPVPGRPLLVDSRARTAIDCRRDDWALPVTLAADPDLARHWARIAAIEHASVASFARFATQLLALGAPPELLRETRQAALDEIRHAQLAYGLASAYAGSAVGPSRLELAGVQIDGSWREIVAALIDEACVGETLGVAEAIAALELVAEPAVRAALTIIAEDEQRHAQLAWRSLAWLLRTASLDDRRWALGRLDSTIAGLGVVAGGLDRPEAGVLGGARRAAAHRQAITEVLEPVARQLAC